MANLVAFSSTQRTLQAGHRPLAIVVDDWEARGEEVRDWLQDNDFDVALFPNARALLRRLDQFHERRCCIAARAETPHWDGLALLRGLRDAEIAIPVVIVSETATAEIFVQAARDGAQGFFEGADFDATALLGRIDELVGPAVPGAS